MIHVPPDPAAADRPAPELHPLGAALRGAVERRAVVVVLLAVLGIELLLQWRLPLTDLVALIPDDSFFYLHIAQRFWATGEFSFDGLSSTYGFQPLWQLVVVAIEPFARDPGSLLYTVLAVCAVLHVATGYGLWRLVRAMAGPWPAALAGLAWLANPALWVWCWGLKENALYALCWVAALGALQRAVAQPERRGHGLRLGLWLGLAVLTRVNAVLAVGVVVPLCLWLPGRSGRVRLATAAVAAGVALGVALPWYAFALWHFGAMLPTSGSWKMLVMRGHVELVLQLPWLGLGHLRHALAATPGYAQFLLGTGFGAAGGPLLVVAACGGLLRLLPFARREPRAGGLPLLAALALAAVASTSNVLCLEKYLGYANWYAVAEFVLLPLAAGLGLSALAAARARFWWCGATALLAGFAAWQWPLPPSLARGLRQDLLVAPPQRAQLLEMGLWLRRNLPADCRVAIWDPGVVAYFRGGTTISLDPLMNSLEYQRRFTTDPFGLPQACIDELQIAYLAGAGLPGQPSQYGALPARPGDAGPNHEVVWLPYPDWDLGWSERRWFQLVRPARTAAPDPLSLASPGFGVLFPNDPARRRVLTGDRDRLLAGIPAFGGDVVRLKLDLPEGARAELHGAEVPFVFTAADNGWRALDLRRARGRFVQLRVQGAGPEAVPQAQLVDYKFP